MEHAVKHAKTIVSVTPQSFLGSLKYDSLRRVISSHANMDAYAFDNVRNHYSMEGNMACSIRTHRIPFVHALPSWIQGTAIILSDARQ